MNLQLTRTSITYLKCVPNDIKIDMNSGWQFILLPDLTLYDIENHIKSIEKNKFFMIIPIFSTSLELDKGLLNLSQPFLIDNNSNAHLITKLVVDQWNMSGFNIYSDKKIIFYLKPKECDLNKNNLTKYTFFYKFVEYTL